MRRAGSQGEDRHPGLRSGYVPSATARGRNIAASNACLAGALALPALVIMLLSGHNAAVCNSGIGQLGQAFDQTVSRDCNVANGVHSLAVAAFIVLAAGCLIATIVHVAGQRQPPPPPGWYGPPPPYWQGPPAPGYPPQGQPGSPPAPPPPGYH